MQDLYSLFKSGEGELGFVIAKDLGQVMQEKLSAKYGSLRQASILLGINQKRLTAINKTHFISQNELDRICSHLDIRDYPSSAINNEGKRMYMTQEFYDELVERLQQFFEKGLEEASSTLGISRSRLRLINNPSYLREEEFYAILKEIDLDLNLEINFNNYVKYIYSGKKSRRRFRLLNNYLSENLCYVLGLIASDGMVASYQYPYKQSFVFSFANKNQILIQKFVKILCYEFPGLSYSKSVHDSGVIVINFGGEFLPRISSSLRIKGKDVKDEEAFLPLLRLGINHRIAFVRGYFDGDGSINKNTKNKVVKIAIHNAHRAENLQQIISSIGIQAKLSHEKDKNGSYMNNLFIRSKKEIKLFIKVVGSNHPRKRTIMDEYLKIL